MESRMDLWDCLTAPGVCVSKVETVFVLDNIFWAITHDV